MVGGLRATPVPHREKKNVCAIENTAGVCECVCAISGFCFNLALENDCGFVINCCFVVNTLQEKDKSFVKTDYFSEAWETKIIIQKLEHVLTCASSPFWNTIYIVWWTPSVIR